MANMLLTTDRATPGRFPLAVRAGRGHFVLHRGRWLAIAALLLAGACAGRGRAEQIARISASESHERVEKKQALLVCPYEKKSCPGAHLAGMITLEDLESQLPTLSRGQELIFCCGCPQEASAAARAADFEARGFTHVEVIGGGILAWIAAGYDVTSSLKDRRP